MSTPINKYNNAILNQYNGNSVNWSSDTIKVMLLTSSYTPNASTDIHRSDIVANEISGTGYTARGQAIGSVSLAQSAGTLTVTGNSIDWAQNVSGFTTAYYAVIYKDTGTDSTSLLIGYINFGANQGIVSGDLIINWNSTSSNGIIFTAS